MSVDIDRIKALHEAATKGPWEASGNGVHKRVSSSVEQCVAVAPKNDAAFIAAARTDLPACVAEIERLRSEVERLQRLCGYMDPNYGVGSTVDKLRSRIADLDARHMQASKERNEAREEVKVLRNSLRAAEAVVDCATWLSEEPEVPYLHMLDSLIKNYNDHCRETTDAND